jgi:opacity protein-like surface antigen
MKRSVFGVAMGLALVATAANAQSMVPAVKPVSFGISAGLSMPTGDFGDGFKSGYNISGLLQFQQPTWPVAIRVEGQFQDFGGKDGLDGASAKTIGGLANLVYYVPTKSTVKPYLTGGLGFFHLKSDLGDSCSDDVADEDFCSSSDNKFGWDLGAGLEFQLSGMSTFVEANWQAVQTEGGATNMVPIRVGIKF